MLPISEFYRDKNTITGHMYHCKICDKVIKRSISDKRNSWAYKGGENPTLDPKYLRDRKKLFDEHGGGWWWRLNIISYRRNPTANKNSHGVRGVRGRFTKKERKKNVI